MHASCRYCPAVLALTLLVRDEVDIVAATIEHHLAAGVDLIIATDNGSVDGTVEVLQAYEKAGVLRLLSESRQDYSQAVWVTRMARLAATEHGAAWVINCDADEFWQPTGGGAVLTSALLAVPSSYGSVVARRTNLVAPPTAIGPWVDRLVYRDLQTMTERGTPLPPKVAHRGCRDVDVAQGNHAVSGPGLLPSAPDELIEILHVPMRSLSQFESKIRNGGSSYASNTVLAEDLGWHWRVDYARLLDGSLPATYAARLPTAQQLEGSARYAPELGLRERLHGLVPHAVVPEALRQALRS